MKTNVEEDDQVEQLKTIFGIKDEPVDDMPKRLKDLQDIVNFKK